MPSVQKQQTKHERIENLVQCFKHPTSTYRRMMSLLENEMDAGLRREIDADIKMFPTYVRSIPDGSETGTYLALDLGGTNFRVLLVKINGSDISMQNKTYLIPQKIMLGTGVQLFDHIADCIGHFMKDHELTGKIPLSFTFSFPCVQEGLARARLSKWTKGFRCEGVVGKDISHLLESAIRRRTTSNVHCLAVVNDGVGTLMSTAHTDHNCCIGLIVGTGYNACYMEQQDRIDGCKNVDVDDDNQMIINTEWGAFGENGCLNFIRTDYDRNVDAHSINPGKQIYEKMVGGMYLGEIARQVLQHLTTENLIFTGLHRDSELFHRGRFYTKYISEIENDRDELYNHTKIVLNELNIKNYTPEDCKVVKYVCGLVSARAAYLVASGIATLINRLNRQDVTIAIDGSLYRFHPRFPTLIRFKIQELIKPGLKFKLVLSHDGSGKGAALVAAVADRIQHETREIITC